MSRRLPGTSALSARHSLRLRLPLLISALIVAVLAVFLWTAYREAEATLLRGGGEHAQSAADQVAEILVQSAQERSQALSRVASEPSVRRYLQQPTDDTRDAARKSLAALVPIGPPRFQTRLQTRRVDLWNDTGSRVLEISIPATTSQGPTSIVLPAGTRPVGAGLSALQGVDNVVFSDAVAEVRDEFSLAGQTPTGARLGYLVVRSTISVNPSLIERLVGYDAVVEIGNRTGGIWTDFSRAVPAPSVDLARHGVAEYREANGQMHQEMSSETPADANLMATAERDQIERVLLQVGGNKAAAAKLLGMSRRSLYRWLDRLAVRRPLPAELPRSTTTGL